MSTLPSWAPPAPSLIHCADERQQSELVCDRVLELYEEGMALRKQAVLFRASHHSPDLETRARPAPHPLHQIRGPALPRSRPREGPACRLSPRRQPERRDGVVPTSPAAARGWSGEGPSSDRRTAWGDLSLPSVTKRLRGDGRRRSRSFPKSRAKWRTNSPPPCVGENTNRCPCTPSGSASPWPPYQRHVRRRRTAPRRLGALVLACPTRCA